MAIIVRKTIWNLDKNIHILNDPTTYHSTVTTQHCILKISHLSNGKANWKPDHLKSELQKVQISNVAWF